MNKLLLTIVLLVCVNAQPVMISTECLNELTAAIVSGSECTYDSPNALYTTDIYLSTDLGECTMADQIGYYANYFDAADLEVVTTWASVSHGGTFLGQVSFWVLQYTTTMAKLDSMIVAGKADLTNHELAGQLTETKTFNIRHEWNSQLGGTMRYVLMEVRIHVYTDMVTQTEEFDVTATEIEKLCPGACCVLEYCEVFITPTATAEFTDSSYEGSALVDPSYEFGDPVFMRIFIDDVNFRNERRLILEEIQIMGTLAATPPVIPPADYNTFWDLGNLFLRVNIIGQKMGEGTYYYMLYLSLATEDLLNAGSWYKLDDLSSPIEQSVSWTEVNGAVRRLQQDKYAVYRQESGRLSASGSTEATESSTMMPYIIGGAVVVVVLLGVVGGLIWKSKKTSAKYDLPEQKA